MTEGDLQNEIRIHTSQRGWRLFRNNNGAMQDATGRWLRFGLANDSKAAGEALKSADLIGIRPVLVTQEMVGKVIGQFASVEVKAPGYRPGNTKREVAQRAWAKLVTELGGFATITDRSDWL